MLRRAESRSEKGPRGVTSASTGMGRAYDPARLPFRLFEGGNVGDVTVIDPQPPRPPSEPPDPDPAPPPEPAPPLPDPDPPIE
jgi:hypothetical protein